MTEEIKWYEKKEYYAAAAFAFGAVKVFTKPNTVAYQLSDYTITIGLPLLMGFFGVKDAKKYGTPSGLSKLFK